MSMPCLEFPLGLPDVFRKFCSSPFDNASLQNLYQCLLFFHKHYSYRAE